MIIRLARQGGRDAVFDVPTQVLRTVPSDSVINVQLASDATVTAVGHVRQVSPQADPVTRTFQVKVGLSHPPQNMLLGAPVTGIAAFGVGVLVGAVAMPVAASVEGAIDHAPKRGLSGRSPTSGAQIARFEGLLVLWALLGVGYGLAVTPASVVLRSYGRAEDRGLTEDADFTQTPASGRFLRRIRYLRFSPAGLGFLGPHRACCAYRQIDADR
jgi:hypothetical protein